MALEYGTPEVCESCNEEKKILNVEKVSLATEQFIEQISEELQPDQYGNEPYYLSVGLLTDGSIVAIFTPL